MPSTTFYNLSKDKQDAIYEAAIRVFAAGYEEAKINHIVSQANIAKGSFYQYFANKEDLFSYIVDRITLKKKEILMPLFLKMHEMPLIDFVYESHLLVGEWIDQEPHLKAISNWLYVKPNTLLTQLKEDSNQQATAFYMQKIQADQEKGWIKKGVDPETLARLIIMFGIEIFNNHLGEGEARKVRLKSAMDIFRKGVENESI